MERKALIEASLMLSVSQVSRALDARRAGARALVAARSRDGDDDTLEVWLTPMGQRTGRTVRLAYRRADADTACSVGLVSVAQHFGGVRWYFGCPLLKLDGEPCTRHVRALYLPPGRRYFGCRWCHDLTYRSQQRPVTHRVQQLAKALAYYERGLERRHPVAQVSALRGAQDAIRLFLDGIEGRDHNA